MTALTDTETYGGTFTVVLMNRLKLDAKVDHRVQDLGLETRAQEYDVRYRVTDHWSLSTGYRKDLRVDSSTAVLPTQQQGERADAVVQLGYDPKSTWSSYAFVQDTLSTTGNRRKNGRYGMGGSYRLSERLHVDVEASNGDLGAGGKIGTNYIHSERTSLYLNYALENERTDNGLRTFNRGREGNLVTGVKSRLSDSTSVFLEECYQHNRSMTGLTHATGVDFKPSDHWSFGINTDIGTLIDARTGAETERVAGGLQFGLSRGDVQFSSAVEFIQKSHIAAVDVTYDLTPRFSIGGKYAYRLSQASLDRENETFFDNNAHLYVLRADYRLFDDWEILVEGRNLTMPDLEEEKAGALVTVSRYLGDHLKLGAGYNFTDFSDDLTDLSYDHQGFFVTITGSL